MLAQIGAGIKGRSVQGTSVSQIHVGYQFDRFHRADEDFGPYGQVRKFCRGRCPHRPLQYREINFYISEVAAPCTGQN